MLRDDRTDGGDRRSASRNVLGEPLEIFSIKPMTGFYRDGCCDTGREDFGSHTVCAVLTSDFLEFSKSRGNDLSTPMPEFGFPGLKPGDRWCLCAPRWREAEGEMQGFKSVGSAQTFLSVHAATQNTFNIQRHLTSARTHRAFRASALQMWREVVAAA